MHIWLQSHSQEKPKLSLRPTRGDCTIQTLPSPTPPPSSHEGPLATPGPLHLLFLCQEDSAPREAAQLVSLPHRSSSHSSPRPVCHRTNPNISLVTVLSVSPTRIPAPCKWKRCLLCSLSSLSHRRSTPIETLLSE